jgi:single stranded DNA-binding protein
MAKIKFEIEKGHLGDDPEIKLTRDDTVMVRMSIAVNRYRKDEDGEWEQVGETSWVNAAAFGYLAEQIEMMELSKGDAVYAAGQMFQDVWEDEDGDERISWNFNLDRLFPIPKVFDNEEEEDDRPRRKKGKKKSGRKSGKRSSKKSGRKSSSRSGSKSRLKGKKSGKKKSSSGSKDRIQNIMKQLNR